MVESVLEKIRMKCLEVFHTIHNYIDTDEMILRKSTIAAHAGEKVLIPINMRDGSVFVVGKGNPEFFIQPEQDFHKFLQHVSEER